jgi:hypothetical protein
VRLADDRAASDDVVLDSATEPQCKVLRRDIVEIETAGRVVLQRNAGVLDLQALVAVVVIELVFAL